MLGVREHIDEMYLGDTILLVKQQEVAYLSDRIATGIDDALGAAKRMVSITS